MSKLSMRATIVLEQGTFHTSHVTFSAPVPLVFQLRSLILVLFAASIAVPYVIASSHALGSKI